ncbi:MAG: hypothetical protein QM762_06500 [Chryseolinea sp.]
MRVLLLLFVLVSFCVSAQDQDSIEAEDSTFFSAFKQPPQNHASPDTTSVVSRSFDSGKVNELKEDPELQYETEATVGESLWQRFLRWLGDLLSSLFDSATTTNWGRFFAYAFLLVAFVVIVLMILKVNAYQVFYGTSASPTSHRTLDENIHEMDFDRLIREALSRKDYRLGVRLQFLYALKMLSDKDYIHWEQGKTNTDYVNELASENLKKGFSELNYYFEYAWYGNFMVTDGVFARVKQTFDDWRRSL